MLELDERVAVWVDRVRVWPTGYAFWVNLVLSPPLEALDIDEDGFFLDWRPETIPGLERHLLRVTTTDDFVWSNQPGPGVRTLSLMNATARGPWSQAQLWVSRLPLSPTVEVALAWPGGEVRCSATFDAEPLRAAAGDALPLPWTLSGDVS